MNKNKKILSVILIVIIAALIALAAVKLLGKKEPVKAEEAPPVTAPAEENKPETKPEEQTPVKPAEPIKPDGSENPVIPEEPQKPEEPEYRDVRSSRDEKATLFYSAEGAEQEFDCSLYVSDFGIPEAYTVYSIYYGDEYFTVSRDGNTDIFENEYGAKMQIALHRGVKADDIAPSFMDSYIDFTDIFFEAATPLGKTGLTGTQIDAYNNTDCARASLIEFEGDVNSVVISCGNEMLEVWFQQLVSMFNSFEIEY